MPRNSQGLYTLPSGNPVISGTLIEAGWANDTMNDLAASMTGSLPRDGTAPMTGQLTLINQAPTNGRHAASKAYVDQFMAFATGMPLASVVAFASGIAPQGFLLCNGQAVSRITYADLFSAIGTTYGAGDGSVSFNVPDLRSEFIRGKDASRTLGSKQAGAVANHNHSIVDPSHSHPITNPAHSHTLTDPNHSHTVTDPGHSHTVYVSAPAGQRDGQDNYTVPTSGAQITSSNVTNVSIVAAPTGIAVDYATQNTSSVASATGITIGSFGDTETRPQNVAMDYYIKAVNDSTGQGGLPVTAITSSDPNAITINTTDPTIPQLDIKTNVAFGLVKLDSNNKVPNGLLDINLQTFLGTFDASGGENPSQAFPAINFGNGDTYVVGVPGTISLYAPDGSGPTMVSVQGGWYLVWQEGFTTPDGWYYIEPTVAQVAASNVAFAPVPGIVATNVQDAISELNTEKPDIASEVPFSPPIGMTSTNVQDAITETFQAAGGTPQAINVTFSPTAGIAANNVQDAIVELESETPDLIGTGASGTWGISITGTAASAATATDATNAVNATTTTTQTYGDADTSIASTAFVDRMRDVPAVVKTAAHVLALTDRGQSIDTNAGVTVPDNATVSFPVGSVVTITNTSAVAIAVTQGVNVTLRQAGTANVGDRTLAQYGVCTARKIALNTWIISGSIS